jgi:hypothetical protein
MSTYGVIPHRLIPGVAGVPADASGLTVTNNNAGGFGSAEWDQDIAPSVAKGDAVAIDLEDRVFEGKVASVSGGIGPQLAYHVACVGRFREHTLDETVHGMFVDRDANQWQSLSGNWGIWPEGEVSVELQGCVSFSWPMVDETICHESATGTAYSHVGNSVPHSVISDYPAADPLWSAAAYQWQANKTITGFSVEVDGRLGTGSMYAMTTPDYTNPIDPADPPHGRRHSTYPQFNYWSDFYRLAATPSPYYVGAYVCDALADLPSADPVAMRTDPHLLQRFDAPLFIYANDPLKLRFAFEGRYLVLYTAYLPVRLPLNLDTRYSKNADHLVRTQWCARNRLYLPNTGQNSFTQEFIFPSVLNFRKLSVYAQGYESAPDGSDDLADAFRIIFPTGVFDSMKLPAPIDDSAPTSIGLRTPTTEAAAVPELLSLYPLDMPWGWWEDDVLTITADAGTVSVSDEIGVDTRGAAQTDEGAVDLVLVEYAPTPAAAEPGAMQLAQTAFLTVDKDGAYEVVDADWKPGAGVRCAYRDATGEASSEVAAARIGQAIAIERRAGQWTGSVSLTAIMGASAIRPGKMLSGPGIAGAIITQTTVDVGADQVTLALGSAGYRGRFPERVPGKPDTARPGGDHDGPRTIKPRRGGGGNRR